MNAYLDIQLEISGPWIRLIRAMTSMDLGIGEAARILNAGLAGIRVTTTSGHVLWEAYRYESTGPSASRFAWRSGMMSAPAFATLSNQPGRDPHISDTP